MAYQEKPLEMLEIIHRRPVTPEIVTGFRLPCFVRFYFTEKSSEENAGGFAFERIFFEDIS